MFVSIRSCVLAACLLPGLAAAQADDPAIDPEAVRIVREAAEFLSTQDRLAADWYVSWDYVIDGREKITYTRSGYNLLARGEGFYSYTDDGVKRRELFFDGGHFEIYSLDDDAYVSTPLIGTFEDLVDRAQAEYGLALPLWEVFTKYAPGEFLEGIEAAAYLGETRIAGIPAYHLAFAQADYDWQLWIAADPDEPLLLSMVGTDPYTQGWPQYRAYFHNWDFAPVVTEGMFRFVPGEETARMTWPKVEVEPGLLSQIPPGAGGGDE